MVYKRSDYEDHLSGFKVFIGNTTKPWITNQPLVEVQQMNAPHTFRVNDSLARFVSVVRQNSDILTLCEVIVDGECRKGTFGDVCNETCGNCLNGNLRCNSTTGQCIEGCQRGWSGITCKEGCKIGAYGYGCNETCGMCFSGNNSCSAIDGQCMLGCEVGWKGETCKQECNRGAYGHECNETCGMCFGGNSNCSTLDGHCQFGCEAGWRGATCKQDCDIGTFGYGCNETCGMCFGGNNTCSSIDGQCKVGCEAGWQGGTCKQGCDIGTYGYGCNESCGMCFSGNKSCSIIDGHCKVGCKAGWRGETCKHVSSEMQTQTCPGVNALAIGGSVGGICVIAIIVNIITVIVLKKRMNKDTSDNEMQMANVNQYLNFADPSSGNVIQAAKGEDNMRKGFQNVDTEYEKLQGRGPIEGSAYSTINYMQTDNPYENNGEGFGIDRGLAINGDDKGLQSVEEELKAIDERRTVLIRQKKEIQIRLGTTKSATK
ncbi:hypothetical protein CHS0354_012951 [Potamilus streckersoni]|uniref:Uncharacterized protein n=1 Tax=Potamilus streckersoni TaxID=2493646 RepID=A0AAE0RNW6_9BIVA|nr:hypothetical protein CHS0354_012951 [Potamilus streckersoni]